MTRGLCPRDKTNETLRKFVFAPPGQIWSSKAGTILRYCDLIEKLRLNKRLYKKQFDVAHRSWLVTCQILPPWTVRAMRWNMLARAPSSAACRAVYCWEHAENTSWYFGITDLFKTEQQKRWYNNMIICICNLRLARCPPKIASPCCLSLKCQVTQQTQWEMSKAKKESTQNSLYQFVEGSSRVMQLQL